ncbi:MAG TPA: hypothetical protein VHB50_05715 [Bryobacteraceae bacterium]|nr:hypothetical protein [Bryobacteraceae bacterium]
MAEWPDALEFAAWARRRWRGPLVCCLTALALATTISLVLPKRYTATASLIIEPPAGMDPRAATTLSPVYLESLRTYERLAMSDTLFEGAIDRLHIRQQYPGRSIESIKRSVLQVTRPVNTRVIDINATLDDPGLAQALAENLAEQTVALNESMQETTTAAVMNESQKLFDSASARLRSAQQAMGNFMAKQTDATGPAEIDAAVDRRFQIGRELVRAQEELADLSSGADAGALASARARATALEAQDKAIGKAISDGEARMGRQKQRRESLEAELASARTGYEAAQAKLADIRASAAFRGERLNLLDRGIVPQRPSSPNLPMNILAALLFSLIGSIGWLAFRFGIDRTRTATGEWERERPSIRSSIATR